MKKWVMVGAMLFFAVAAKAEVINISGKVFKEGTTEGLPGARISLKKFYSVSKTTYSPAVCYSAADGTFKLSANTGTINSPVAGTMGSVTIRSVGHGSGFTVTLSSRIAHGSVDIFRTDGRRVATKRISGSSNGEYFIPFTHSISAICMVKVSMNSESRMFKTIPGMGLACSMMSGNTSAAGGRLGKHAASASDSLVVTKEGFRTALLPIQKYDMTDISVPVKTSQPWISSGTLEHQGGMVKIMAKGHDFEMGQPCDTVRGIFFDMPTTDIEQPVHTVSFTHDFWMDTVEVQQGEFDSLLKKTYPSYKGAGWNASNGMGRTVAVYSVLWGDAALFCNARSKSHGLPDTAYSYTKIIGRIGNLCTLQNVTENVNANAYRLPTEAEWEFAARGGTTTDYYWGKNESDLRTPADTAEVDKYAVWYKNSAGLGRDTTVYGTHETGKLKPNNYGLYDMLGNVSEWCNDWYDPYGWGAVTDPKGPATGFIQVQRGGNWGNNLSYIRVTDREFMPIDYPYFFMGFRVAKQIN